MRHFAGAYCWVDLRCGYSESGCQDDEKSDDDGREGAHLVSVEVYHLERLLG